MDHLHGQVRMLRRFIAGGSGRYPASADTDVVAARPPSGCQRLELGAVPRARLRLVEEVAQRSTVARAVRGEAAPVEAQNLIDVEDLG